MAKIVYGIKTCLKYEHKLAACLNTWAKDQEILLSTDLTELDVVEGYDSLTRKSKRFFGTNTFEPGKWLLYCDDDTFVNVKALNEHVDKLDPQQVVMLGRGCMPCTPKTKKAQDPLFNRMKTIPRHTLFQGGAGTLISYPALLILQTLVWTGKAPDHDLFLAEDQWVTATMRSYCDLMATYLGHKKTIRWGGKLDGEEEMFQTLYNEKAIERIIKGEAVTLHHVPHTQMEVIHEKMTQFQVGTNLV